MANIKQVGENKYQITVSNGVDSYGKRLREYKTIELNPKFTPKQLEKELQKQALLFEEEVKKGLYLDGNKITFARFVERWETDYAEIQLAPKTYFRYKGLLKRIIPAIGHIIISDLQPVHLLRFYSNLAESGIREDVSCKAHIEVLEKIMNEMGITVKELAKSVEISPRTVESILAGKPTKFAPRICEYLNIRLNDIFIPTKEKSTLCNRTIMHHHRLICSILNVAVQWQVIVSNPAARVKPPKVETQTEARHFEEAEVEKMLELLETEPIKYKAMIYITLFTGCRLGELSGLEWDDINLDEGMIRIKQAGQYIPGIGSFIKEPKNEGSKRVISLPPMVVAVLKEYRAWQSEQRLKLGELWDLNKQNESDEPRYFVFTQWDGKPIYPTTPSNWFRKFLNRNDLPYVNFHGLRHTSASILIAENVDIQTIAKRLGHTKPTTTTSIYSHFLKKPDEEAAQKFENLFNKNKESISKQA